MNKWIYLSRVIQNVMPCYNNKDGVHISCGQSIESGDSVNSLNLTIDNHIGTHIDFPRHFIRDGKTLNDYTADYFIFRKIGFVSCHMDKGRYITSDELESAPCAGDIDILIIKTGFSKYYDTARYWNDNPGISYEAARYIKDKYHYIRALGIDSISINSYKDKADGRKAHIELLTSPEILIIEGMNLSNVSGDIIRLFALPLLIRDADGAPCTVIAEVRQ